ncbi:MAG: CBS domain-containing protein [Oceanicoccus sp.]|jgi:CBS domain-containing protein
MFYIYTPTGRSFSGPLEKLRRTEKPAAAAAARSAQQDPIDEISNAAITKIKASAYQVSVKAITEYDQHLDRGNNREPIKHAFQIMTTDVQSLNASSSVQQALVVFQSVEYQVLPITDNSQVVVGDLSRKKLYEYLLEKRSDNSALNKPISEVFISNSSKVFSAAPVTDIRRIAAVLVEYNLDALPIVQESGQLVGIISRTDILKSATTDPPLSLWC